MAVITIARTTIETIQVEISEADVAALALAQGVSRRGTVLGEDLYGFIERAWDESEQFMADLVDKGHVIDSDEEMELQETEDDD